MGIKEIMFSSSASQTTVQWWEERAISVLVSKVVRKSWKKGYRDIKKEGVRALQEKD